jgi:hypothetical protein
MATICPKDGKGCIDDMCRGSGVCGITGMEMWDICDRCHGVYSSEFDVECACEPDDDYEDDRDDGCPRCGNDVPDTDIVAGRCGECRLHEDEADWTDEAEGPLN